MAQTPIKPVKLGEDDEEAKKKKKKKDEKPEITEPGDNGPDGGGVADATTPENITDPAPADAASTDVAPEPTPGETPPEEPKTPEVSEGPHPMMAEAIALCHQDGLHIGEDSDESNFIERFIVAMKTKLAAENPDETGTGQGDDNKPIETSPPIIGMSQQQSTRLEELEKKDFKHRLDNLVLTGRITKPVKEKLVAQSEKVSLSSTDPSKDRDSLMAKVEAYEELPPGNTGFTDEDIMAGRIREMSLSDAGSIHKGPNAPPDQKESQATIDELAARAEGNWDQTKNEVRTNGKVNGKH